jgi:hypothetical protein
MLYLAIGLRVGREPRGDGVRKDSPKTVTSQLHGRGRLSSRTFWGATRRQGQRDSLENPHRLDPDGWLVRSQTDISINESPAARRGLPDAIKNDQSTTRQLRLRMESCCPLDTRLLMGGTHQSSGKRRRASISCQRGSFFQGYSWMDQGMKMCRYSKAASMARSASSLSPRKM